MPGSRGIHPRTVPSAADRIAASEAAAGLVQPPSAADPRRKAEFHRRRAQGRAGRCRRSEPAARRKPKRAVAPSGGSSQRLRKLLVAGGAVVVAALFVHVVLHMFQDNSGSAISPPPLPEHRPMARPKRIPRSRRRRARRPAARFRLPAAAPNAPAALPGQPLNIAPNTLPDPSPGAAGARRSNASRRCRKPPTSPARCRAAGCRRTAGQFASAEPGSGAVCAGADPAGCRRRQIAGDDRRTDAARRRRVRRCRGRIRRSRPASPRATAFRRATSRPRTGWSAPPIKGLAPAQFRLGGLYEKGIGVKKDLAKARDFYAAAADKGNGKAMHNLAVLYAEGINGPADYKTAAIWFRKAADHGITDSQYNLAILYARGIGVEQNYAEVLQVVHARRQSRRRRRGKEARRSRLPSRRAIARGGASCGAEVDRRSRSPTTPSTSRRRRAAGIRRPRSPRRSRSRRRAPSPARRKPSSKFLL